MNSRKITIGIYGYGAFGKLMAQILSKYFNIITYSKSLTLGNKDEHAEYVSEKELAQNSDFLIFSIPVQYLDAAAKSLAQQEILPRHTPIADVSSVKAYPLQVLRKHFPQNPILGTHPIFGPQSVSKYGLAGSKIVLSNMSFQDSLYNSVKNFLLNELQLVVVEKSPEDHDREMAYIQGLTHFIGRALTEIDIQEFATETFSYKHLVELKDLLKDDSWDLFVSIENYNEYAKRLRQDFLNKLQELNSRLDN